MKIAAEYTFAAMMTILFAAVTFLVLYWVLFDTDPPVLPVAVAITDINGVPTSKFRPGDLMLVRRENCTKRAATVWISRQIVRLPDRIAYVVPSGNYALQLGCHVSVNQVEIPLFFEPGVYEYEVSMYYSNNPLVHSHVRLQTFRFYVGP